jgi:hypothetical protein
VEKKTNEKYKIKNKLFKVSSKRKWVVSSIKLSLEEAERQTTGIQLEGFFKNYRESARINGVNEDLI